MNKIDCLMPITEYPDGEKYFHLAYASFIATSHNNSNLKIHLDGPNPKVKFYMDNKGIKYTESNWKGLTLTLDEMIRESSAEYVIPVHDDCAFAPWWDTNLVRWFDVFDDDEMIVCPKLISHQEGTMFGKDIQHFDFFAFCKYVKENMLPTMYPWKSGVQLMKRQTYLDVGGYDLQFSPFGYFDLDYHLRCVEKGIKLVQAQNSILWHFGATSKKHIKNTGRGMDNDAQLELFIEKYGDTPLHMNDILLSRIGV